MSTILIVEDEESIRLMASFTLRRAGFEVFEAEDTAAADRLLLKQKPDLLLVDWMLPDISGIDWVRQLKQDQTTKHLPVIMLTARAQESDKILGLDAGADDYVTKPFSPRELTARINAVLRRYQTEQQKTPIEFKTAALTLNSDNHCVTIDSTTLEIGPTEFKLLKFFMTHPSRVFSREQLLNDVWGRNHFIEERTVDVHILRLRKVLAEHGYDKLVQTVRGVGYRFTDSIS